MRHARLVWASFIAAGLAACAVGTTGTKSFEQDGVGDDGGDPWHSRDGASSATGGEGGACTDTTSDPNNCGSCGHACELGDASALAFVGDDNPDSGIPPLPDAGPVIGWSHGVPACAASACGITCPSPMTACDDVCFDTSRFHEHCGDCNTACGAAQICTGGHCCSAGQGYCASACIDVLSNNANCGACGNVCGGGTQCVAGRCSTCSINEALSATATGSGGGATPYGPDTAKDGVLETGSCTSFAWITATNAPGSSWIQYAWPTAKTLTKMHMDTSPGTTADSCGVGRTLGAAQIQWWNGATWITDGTVSGKMDDWDYTFTAPVTTTQVRLYAIYCTNTQGQNSNPMIYEWQVTGCN